MRYLVLEIPSVSRLKPLSSSITLDDLTNRREEIATRRSAVTVSPSDHFMTPAKCENANIKSTSCIFKMINFAQLFLFSKLLVKKTSSLTTKPQVNDF